MIHLSDIHFTDAGAKITENSVEYLTSILLDLLAKNHDVEDNIFARICMISCDLISLRKRVYDAHKQIIKTCDGFDVPEILREMVQL